MKGECVLKLNYEALRAVMIEFQEAPLNPDVHNVVQSTINKYGFTTDDILYAVKQAIDEGLLSGHTQQTVAKWPVMFVSDITPDGHKFLDSIIPETAWNKVKSELITNGIPMTIPTITRTIAKLFLDK